MTIEGAQGIPLLDLIEGHKSKEMLLWVLSAQGFIVMMIFFAFIIRPAMWNVDDCEELGQFCSCSTWVTAKVDTLIYAACCVRETTESCERA
eukprot:CAMPEP_0119535378 /NCGR_PEP_ID=MMETSP1344-20130328/48428_1 /TAXON_ID=236787 /ORGANISM="Florenciella parvula, Strain CCMP2471" /LENGTH=91 /DNA_ID=CAMNT_0007576973 /DNA_START=146 /DNA_END=421 /DNA_ORIENTATION=-